MCAHATIILIYCQQILLLKRTFIDSTISDYVFYWILKLFQLQSIQRIENIYLILGLDLTQTDKLTLQVGTRKEQYLTSHCEFFRQISIESITNNIHLIMISNFTLHFSIILQLAFFQNSCQSIAIQMRKSQD